MSPYEQEAVLRNKQLDALTNKFHGPLPFEVRSVGDLDRLRQAWLKREAIPCLINSREDASDNSFLGLDIRTFLSGDNSSGRLSAHDIIIAPGAGLPRYVQTAGEFYISVIEGELELTVGTLTQPSRPGTFAYIPSFTTGAIVNKSNAPARLFMITYPAGADRAFAEAHALWKKTGDANPAPYLAILERYGFSFNPTSAQQNDARTNMAPERMEAEIHSIEDFQTMRANWSKRSPIPKLLHSSKSTNNLALEGDSGAASTSGGVMFSGDETSGHAVMFAGDTGPHYSAFNHFQPTEEELFYVVSGDFELTCGSATGRIKRGAFGFAPRGATHGFLNPSDTVTTVITMNSPAGHERGFEMLGRHQQKKYDNIEEQMRAHGWEARDKRDFATV